MCTFESCPTQREKEVLKLVSLEMNNKEIAAMLSLSHHTIKTHKKHLMQKMQVKNSAGLVRAGFEKGYLQLKQNSFK